MQWTPPAAALDDLEMLLLGAYRPLTGFLGRRDATNVLTRRQLSNGTPWPVPIVLRAPDEVAQAAADVGILRLTDEEAAPVGDVIVSEVWSPPSGGRAVAGAVRAVGTISRGAYPHLRRAAEDGGHPNRPLLAVPVRRAPDHGFLESAQECAAALAADVMLMPMVGHGQAQDLDPAALVRATRAVSHLAASDAAVIPLPLPLHEVDGEAEQQLLGLVAAAYGATHVVAPRGTSMPAGGAVPVVLPDGRQQTPFESRFPGPVERELRRGRRLGAASSGVGVAVLLTGLSGSGKSTIARALHQALLERTDRTVSLLDGDIVRRMLSSELGFSREHRELNVRRIGYVAAEIARHGGIAICAPIAPYASTRQEFRAMVEAVGALVLVYVDTPLDVCEARDRKGLYARARAGQLPAFTGISDPYEEPVDADLRIDTSKTSVDEAVIRILSALRARGVVDLEEGEVHSWT